jgi:hypothetical protein
MDHLQRQPANPLCVRMADPQVRAVSPADTADMPKSAAVRRRLTWRRGISGGAGPKRADMSGSQLTEEEPRP